MSVNPGFGGQKLPARQPRQDPPAARADRERAACTRRSRWTAAWTPRNVRALVEAGAEILVAGSAVFGRRRSRGGGAPAARGRRVERRVVAPRVRVRYAETDQMGVAWHGEYFAWFEVGRTDLLRERGLHLPRAGGARACACP